MKQILTASLLFFAIGLFAQPANDDCNGIIDLGLAPGCDSTLYNNIGATQSDIGTDNFPFCYVGTPARDVWFQFTATADFLDYRIEVIGCEDTAQGIAAMTNPQIAIYRGDCLFDGLQLLDCVSASQGEGSVFADLIGLTPNIPYFLRINDWSSTGTPNAGAFKLCVKERPPINTVDQGGSTECSGVLTDTGGEFGDYGNNENFTYTICPSQPHECILFTLEYYNVEFGIDQLFFYDGPNTASPLIGNISGEDGVVTQNEGGVCYSVAASSGCLTVQFVSDSNISFEGFLGQWQCTSEACPEPAEMIVDTDIDQTEIVQSVISGQSLISLVNVNCANGTVGTFTISDDSDLNMDKGLVLSTGSVTDIGQASDQFASSEFCNFDCSDEDLNTLSVLYGNGEIAEDACIVQMDVLAASDELTFEYVFGSEEYPEFIEPGTPFNDIFAFLVSGPGITGDPNIGNQLNVATLPDGTFIQIEDLNHSVNWQYYRDNSNNPNIVYDGLTSDSLGVKKSLTARVPTIPCETYTLKFAIADRGDAIYDSGVFISKINTGTPEVSINYQNGINYLVESCTAIPDEIVIDFGNQINSTQVYHINVSGTAVNGTDYNMTISDSVVFETGTEIFTFPVTVLPDNLVEGTETIVISLTRDFGCGETVISTLEIPIQDMVDVEIVSAVQDTAILCASTGCIPLEVEGAQTYSWFPDTLFDDPTSATPVICTQTSQWVYVEGTVGMCSEIDSVYINVIDVQVTIQPDVENIEVCEGEVVTVVAENNVNDMNLLWTSFFTTFPDPTNPVQVFDDTGGFGFQSATVTIDIGGCTATDFINITWVPFDVPEVVSDMTICQNSVVQLAEQIESLSTTYQWTPEEGLLPSAQVSGPFAMPDQTTTYTLVSTAGTGDTACKDTASVTLTVLPADIDIDQGDTTFICLGETATLTNTHTPNALDIMWSPSEFLTVISPEEVEVTPPASQYYYATIETADCVVTDSIWVQVDSLPDLSIMADPMKPSYCEGEEVLLSSPTYEPAHFSAIEHFWDPNGPGAQTPDSFLNMVIIALEDFTYIRTTTVNACTSVDSIFIKVTPVTSISVVPSDTTVCPGDQVQLTIEGPAELTEFMWMPPDGLSCTDCREPIATAQQSVTYQVEAEFEGCPVGASATINVPSQFFSYTGPTVVCPGTTVLLNSIFLPGAIYNWTSSNGSVNTTEPQPSTTLNETTTFNLTASLGECTFETSFTIEVLEDFTVSVEQPGTSCPGDAVTLSAVADPSSPNINYSWTNATTGQMVTGNPVTVNPVETATWTLTATDACFTNTVDVVVEVAPQFGVTVSPAQDNVIAGTPSTFTASATTAGIDFVWQEIPGGAQVGTGPSITVTNCESQQYQVTGTDFNGCTQTAFAEQIVSDAFSVGTPILLAQNGDTIVFSDPLMGVDSAIYEGEQVEMVVEVTPPVSGATYIWVVNGDTITTTQDPSSGLLFLPEVSFDINSFFEVIVVGPSGCDDRGVLEHFILNNPVEAPNVFTPNNDQKNDKFALVSLRPVEILDFRVWNRWGKLVYDNKDGQGFWDGTINGKPAASDVYVFSITYQIPGSNNPMKPLRGDLTLLR